MVENQPPRRGASRFLAGLPAVLHLERKDFRCVAHNLSRTGVLLCGAFPSPPSGAVKFTLHSAAGDIDLRLGGQVQRIFPGDVDGEHDIGVAFEVLDEPARERLEALISRVVEGTVPAVLEALSATPTDQAVREALAKVPLAHRIALGARAMPRERGFLMLDTSPQVFEAVARNPGLLAHEARTLLRLHTLLPSTLEILSREAKWQSDEELKILIATHPRAPFHVADRLVSGLGIEGMRKAIQRPGLNPGVRTKISQKLARPGGRGS